MDAFASILGIQRGAEFVFVGGRDPALDHGVDAEDFSVSVGQWTAARPGKDVRVVEYDRQTIEDFACFRSQLEASQPQEEGAAGVPSDLGSIVPWRFHPPDLSNFQVGPPNGIHGLDACLAAFWRSEPGGSDLCTGRNLYLENGEVLLRISRHDLNGV